MKKIISLVSLILCTLAILTIYFIKQDNNKYIAVYLDNIEGTFIPDRNSNYIIDKIICDNDAVGTWDNANWGLLVTNMSKRSNCKTYFRSKKDITIIYDNNYIKNNIFEDVYDLKENGALEWEYIDFSYNLARKNGESYITMTSKLKDEYLEMPDLYGIYFNYNTSELIAGNIYTYSLEIRGNFNHTIDMGCENGGLIYKNCNENWQKYTHTFTASNSNSHAFRFYNWGNASEKRTLEVRNLSLQEGEYDNFSTTILKEYDNLNNTLPTPTRENYTFLGWYTDPIEGEKISSETIVTEDTTYYAHWQYNESE